MGKPEELVSKGKTKEGKDKRRIPLRLSFPFSTKRTMPTHTRLFLETVMSTNKPVHTLKIGSLHASIWLNTSQGGNSFYTTTIERRYREGNDYKSTGSYNHEDLLNVAKLAKRAEEWIATKLAENRTSAAAA
jgi:hypothetical protein